MDTAKVVNGLDGKPIILNELEQFQVKSMGERMYNAFGPREKMKNALGYEIQMTSLTTILKKVSQQKFFEISPADYLPVRVGEGAWGTNLTAYRSFSIGDQWETGIVNTGGNNARLASADAAVDSVNIKIFPWAKSVGWSIIDLEMAAKSGSWDLIEAKGKALKKDWDLGIQRLSFLGMRGMNGPTGQAQGLLALPGATVNTSIITAPISAYTPAQLKAFCVAIVESYRANSGRTVFPTHFIMPESDYNGLASQASPDFPIKSTLQLLEEMFKVVCRNAAFKILPLAYADAAYHADVSAIAGKQVYMLLNYDEESLQQNIPVDFTPTAANTIDGFGFQYVAYGQATGVLLLRPLELIYYVY